MAVPPRSDEDLRIYSATKSLRHPTSLETKLHNLLDATERLRIYTGSDIGLGV